MGATMAITVYHLETSRSEHIVWLMEELGLPYDLLVFPRETAGAAPHQLKHIHALGKAPVIRDGDIVLAESGGSSTISSIAGVGAWRFRPRFRVCALRLLAALRRRQPDVAAADRARVEPGQGGCSESGRRANTRADKADADLRRHRARPARGSPAKHSPLPT